MIRIFFSIIIVFTLSSCASIKIPSNYRYQVIHTSTYSLVTWQKITNANEPIRIYVEGDGYAFDKWGRVTSDPTPRSTIVRELAFNDYNSNVVYIARPCQFIKTRICTEDSWSTGRFSLEAVVALYEATKKIAGNQEVIYIGYSGGALLSGLVIQNFSDLNIKKWITIAGLLNHKAWTDFLKLNPLVKSINLKELPKVAQIHFIGENDKIIPVELQKQITKNKNLVIIPYATHNQGLEKIYSLIYSE